jgi:hypothetical protein
MKKENTYSAGLHDLAYSGLLPTPKVGGKEGYETRAKRQGHQKAISHLEAFVEYQMLPTPATRDYKGGNSMDHLTRKEKSEGNSHQDQLPNFIKLATGETSQLNPQFVLEMMGFPPDWTELPFLSGEMNPSNPEETQ